MPQGCRVHWLDVLIAVLFLVAMLGAGLWWGRRQRADRFFVGERDLGAGHLSLSIAATDVGGGFSIGLAGLGFTMGLSASWLLATGLIGAWLAAVLVVPRVKPIADRQGWESYADFMRQRSGPRAATVAAVVSLVGYSAFVGAQVLAGAKLATAAFDLSLVQAVIVLAITMVVYTTAGGLEAVVYTDTVQWIIVVVGMVAAVPLAIEAAGGSVALIAQLPSTHLRLDQVSWEQGLVWVLSILPIWFVAMTLYQRIYAARDERAARRAFFIAGVFEYPIIAFLGAGLGVCARALFPDMEAERAVPRMLREVLPTGLAGLVLSAYFAAILSTADSCLLAASGHVARDLHQPLAPHASVERRLRVARAATVLIGVVSVGIAMLLPSVLDVMLAAYGLMVSGLLFPTLVALFRPVPQGAALASMIGGGGACALLTWRSEWAPLEEPIVGALPVGLIGLIAGWALERFRLHSK